MTTKAELLAQLQATYQALDDLTEEVGCPFDVAMVLVDTEQVIKAAKADKSAEQNTRQKPLFVEVQNAYVH